MTDDGPPPGYIKMARKAFDAEHGDSFWHEPREFSRWEAWVYVIQLAAFRAGQFVTSSEVVKLERGEFVASRRHLAKKWQWTEKRVRIWLATVQKRSRLRAQRETKAGTVYLIVNYDTYQGVPEYEGQAKGPVKGQAGAQQGPKIEAGKAGKAVTTSPDGEIVLSHFLAVHPRRRIGSKDRAAVAKALTLGYTAAELCEAIDGNAADEWACKAKKHELYYTLRDTGTIDNARLKAEPEDQPIVDQFGCFTEYGERVTRPSAWTH